MKLVNGLGSGERERKLVPVNWGRQMFLLLAISAATGAIVGARFRIFALGPMSLGAIAVTLANDMANGDGAGLTLLRLFGSVAALQVGYFAFCIIRSHLPRRALVDYSPADWDGDTVLKSPPRSSSDRLRAL